MAYYFAKLTKTLKRDIEHECIWTELQGHSTRSVRKNWKLILEIQVGDCIYAYHETPDTVEHIGIAIDTPKESKRPYETPDSGKTDNKNNLDGYYVRVCWYKTDTIFHESDLGDAYQCALFRECGLLNKNDKFKRQYLTRLNDELGDFLLSKSSIKQLSDNRPAYLDITTEVLKTRKERAVQATFRKSVLERWQSKCAITETSNMKYLVASHIKPWKDSDNNERLDPYNGIPLLVNYDFTFDKCHISFKDDGTMLFDKSQAELFKKLGVDTTKKLKIVYVNNKKYLAHHREKFYETAAAPSEPRSDVN